ncbi:putative PB1 domain protein [Aspergillus undulatus]|uniref:putative PB1 domain protein n=1 Tax=Aspergillus undulatus TaxID=1810928 RepID=UPI003CCD207C
MSLKQKLQEIETWVQALDHFDAQEYDLALRSFAAIADTSKILFNCGVIYATLGEHEKAVECYQSAVSLDQYLAIAYFQEGVSNFLLGDFEEALANFNDTLLYLRGNTYIDYEQLGLKFRLYSCEVLFNRGLCYIYLQQVGPGMQDLEYAAKEKVTPDHNVIDDAIRERAEGYTVFSIPVGVVYRPNEAKVKNLKTKDYLGKSRIVAANRLSTPVDMTQRTADSVPFATSQLVQKNLTSRSRQQSEPPMNRNLFPPTPPPDTDKASLSSSGSMGGATRAPTVKAQRPPKLDLDRPGAQHGRSITDLAAPEKPRIGTTRTASEPRGPPRQGRGYASENHGYSRASHSHRRGASETGFVVSNGYPEVPYGSYGEARVMAIANGGRPFHQQGYIDEEEEYGSSPCDEEVAPDAGFELMGSGSRQRARSCSRGPARGYSRRPEVRKFRVKVHSSEDTRYIIIPPTIEFTEFETRIREKFGFQMLLKIKMQDEGDMITMVDQEDLDLLLMASREMARREGSEMGKMEHAPITNPTNMTDLTPTFADLVHKHNSSVFLHTRPLTTKTADEFLKEAYRINTHISSLLTHLHKIRPSYLSISTHYTKSKSTSTSTSRHRASPSTTASASAKETQLLSPAELDNITSSTSSLLHTLSTSISNLSSAESLRQETHSTLLDKKYNRKRSRGVNLLFQWAAGSSALSPENDGREDAGNAGKKEEQIIDEQIEKLTQAVRESILWFLRRRLEGTIELQRDMVEKRIERAREREKSVLYKNATSFSTHTAAPSSTGADGAISAPSTYPDAALETADPGTGMKGSSTLDASEVAAIEAQLSPQQLQLFAEENDSMVRYYEDTLGKVQNAEKSLLEISSLQQTLVSHLSTQDEYITMMVSDASNTESNIGRGNKELKRATDRRSTAQGVFWGTVVLCSGLVVWDLIF